MNDFQQHKTKMDRTEVLFVDQEIPQPVSSGKHGGWITFPFIIATMGGSSLAFGGWINNIIVYLIQEFNVKSITAAQVFNIFNGCTLIFPIVGAILADSYLGCFAVIWISSLIALLGTLILVLTSAMKNLRPPRCENGSNICQSASQLQYGILYMALALASIGLAGTRYTIGPMGANQFDKPKHREFFFNWYVCTLYTFMAISSTAIVYVEDNVSWTLGFGICAAANVLGLLVFLAGSRFYHDIKPTGSPFGRLGHVILAAVWKRNRLLSNKGDDYNQGPGNASRKEASTPSNFFSFLNRAALKTEAESQESCTVEEIEDLKSLIKLVPLWLTGLILCIPLVMQISLVTILALSMDRHIGSHFKIPAGSMSIFNMISVSIGSILIDRLLFPLWEKTGRRALTPLQRIGIGHVLTVISMALTAMVESRRLKINKLHHLQEQSKAVVTPMSAFWLVAPLVIVGFGEAFHFPGHVAFYYQEFPASLKSTSTAIMAMFIGLAYYLGNVVMDILRKTTDWLPDNINKGRLDNVFWVCCVIATLNFGYYLVCARLYKYQHADKTTDG